MMGENNLDQSISHGSSPPVYSDVNPVSFPFLITTITLTADLHLMLQEPFNDD